IAFVYNRRFQNLEKWYFSLSLLTSLIIASIPLTAGRLGWDTLEETCWYKDQYSSSSFYWKYFTFYGPVSLAMIVSLVMAVPVVVKLVSFRKKGAEKRGERQQWGAGVGGSRRNKETNNNNAHGNRNSNSNVGAAVDNVNQNTANNTLNNNSYGASPPASPTSVRTPPAAFAGVGTVPEARVDNVVPALLYQGPRTKPDNIIKRLVPRILLYPLIPLIGIGPLVIFDILVLSIGTYSFHLLLICYIAVPIQGILTALVFFICDPAWYKIQKAICKRVRKRFGLGGQRPGGNGAGGGNGSEGGDVKGGRWSRGGWRRWSGGLFCHDDEEGSKYVGSTLGRGEIETGLAIEAALPSGHGGRSSWMDDAPTSRDGMLDLHYY
ncbi:hypothetical protein HK102_011646, partial [Quaeritorhiza haematococci]